MIKHFTTSLFDKYVTFSKKLESKNHLLNKTWVMFNQDSTQKMSIYFTDNNKLYVSVNGNINNSVDSWELINHDTLIIHISVEGFVYKKYFLDDNFLVFRKDNSKEMLVLVSDKIIDLNQLNNLDDVKNHLSKIYDKPKKVSPEDSSFKKSHIDVSDKGQTIFLTIIAISSILFCLYIPYYVFEINWGNKYYIMSDPKGFERDRIILVLSYVVILPLAFWIIGKLIRKL